MTPIDLSTKPGQPQFREWDEIFPSGSMTVAAVDRLVHHCHIVGIKGDSYRQKALLHGFLAIPQTRLRD